MDNINQRINGSWLDVDAYRHYAYEDIYAYLQKYQVEGSHLKAIEFGSLQPTTPPLRMLKNIYGDRIEVEVGRPFPEDDLMQYLPYGREYNFVIADQVLEHVTDPYQAIFNMEYLLKPGGHLIVAMPFLYPIHNCPVDISRLTPDGLRQLFTGYQGRVSPFDVVWVNSWGGKEVYRWWLDHLFDWVSIDKARNDCPGFNAPEYGSDFCMIVWAIARKK